MQHQTGADETILIVDGAIPSNLDDLPKLPAAGVLGFKSFLCDTGTDDSDELRQGLTKRGT